MNSPSITISELVSNIASYFDMSSAIAEREAEVADISVRDSIFCVDNMSGVGFFDSAEMSVTITDPDNRPRDIFIFIVS